MRILTQKTKLLEANVDQLKQKGEDLEVKLLQAQDTAARAKAEGQMEKAWILRDQKAHGATEDTRRI